MSFNGMLKHRGQPYRLQETQINGYSAMVWAPLPTTVPCFLDLNFLRPGKDPSWTPEAGRSDKRSGVLFTKAQAGLRPGDRVKMTRGPSGVFQVNGAIDEAWRPLSHHHSELSVEEVAQSTIGQEQPSDLPALDVLFTVSPEEPTSADEVTLTFTTAPITAITQVEFFDGSIWVDYTSLMPWVNGVAQFTLTQPEPADLVFEFRFHHMHGVLPKSYLLTITEPGGGGDG